MYKFYDAYYCVLQFQIIRFLLNNNELSWGQQTRNQQYTTILWECCTILIKSKVIEHISNLKRDQEQNPTMATLITQIYFEICTLSYIILQLIFNLNINIIFMIVFFLHKIFFMCAYACVSVCACQHEFIQAWRLAEQVKVYGAGFAAGGDPLFWMLVTEAYFSSSITNICKC